MQVEAGTDLPYDVHMLCIRSGVIWRGLGVEMDMRVIAHFILAPRKENHMLGCME